jgi:hypothetical protein
MVEELEIISSKQVSQRLQRLIYNTYSLGRLELSQISHHMHTQVALQ